MPTTQTQLPPPNTVGTNFSRTDYFWLTGVQNAHPMRTVDTSAGSYSEATPPAGGAGENTGQSNQNVEITYKKISADGNTFTLTGVADGLLTLTAQYSLFKIKSDGTNWWRSG